MTKHTQAEAKSTSTPIPAMQPAHSGLLPQQEQEEPDRSLLLSEDRLRSPSSPTPPPLNPSVGHHSFGTMAIGPTTLPVLQRRTIANKNLIQRQENTAEEEKEEEEPIQTKAITSLSVPPLQRQMNTEEEEKNEEEEAVQTKAIAPLSVPSLQRQMNTEEEERNKEEEAVQTKAIAPLSVPALQRQVNPEEEEEKTIQAKALPGQGLTRFSQWYGQMVTQAKVRSVPGVPVLQRKLAIGQPGDKYEQEADRVAEQVMQMTYPKASDPSSNNSTSSPIIQRLCPACEEDLQRPLKEEEQPEKTSLQMKWLAAPVTPLLQQQSANTPSAAKLLEQLNQYDQKAEQGTDQPEVPASNKEEVVQGKSEAIATDGTPDLESQLNSSQGGGQALPENTRSLMESAFGVDFSGVRIHTSNNAVQMNRQLSAQAFTHGSDIYFNSGKYEPQSHDGRRLLAHELTHVVQQNSGLAKKSIQRTLTFATKPRPKGPTIHQAVLPRFVKHNADLFIEVKIPGANKVDVEKGKTGIADFYKAVPERTIGIKMDEQPEFLKPDTKLEWGGGKFRHNKDSAPQGATTSPKVRNLDNAPISIQIGDLKPGASSESILGTGQVKGYQQGIKTTADALNSYLAANPGETNSVKKFWNPSTSTMTNLNIPPELIYPTGKGIFPGELSLYQGEALYHPELGLVGSMYVYKDKGGIWSYEWIPKSIPASTGSGQVNQVLKRLNTEVIPPLLSAGTTVQPKRLLQTMNLSPKLEKRIQRKDQKFKDEDWKAKHYTPWKKDAEKFLGDNRELKKAQVAEALVELKDRVGSSVYLPKEVEERGHGLSKIHHWKKFGRLYGWLREKFDFFFVKIHAFAKKIKDKAKKLSKSVGSTSFGNWIKAAVKVIFKIFKMVGAWALNQVMDKLVDSLREGISNNIKKLVDMATPEGVKSKIEEFEEMKEQYQKLIEDKEEELTKRFFGDKLALFEKAEEIENIVGDVSTIVTIVEWGIRLLACASPPAIGCLWNLAISALQAAFALLIQTCWFTRKVYGPILSNIAVVRNFPTEIAAKIATSANQYIPMPAGLDPLFAPITISNTDFSPDCEGGDGAGRLTPEREAILELVEQIGKEKFEALLELMNKRSAGPWVLLTVERLAELKGKLQDISTEDLKKASADPKSDVPESLESFLEKTKQYSKQEKKLIDESRKAKGAKGAASSSDDSISPTYGSPGKLTGKVSVAFAAAVPLKKFEVGKEYKDEIAIYLRVAIKDENKSYSVIFRDVMVKVKSVGFDKVVFVNEAAFYGNYTSGKFVFFEKGYLFTIGSAHLIYED